MLEPRSELALDRGGRGVDPTPAGVRGVHAVDVVDEIVLEPIDEIPDRLVEALQDLEDGVDAVVLTPI